MRKKLIVEDELPLTPAEIARSRKIAMGYMGVVLGLVAAGGWIKYHEIREERRKREERHNKEGAVHQ